MVKMLGHLKFKDSFLLPSENNKNSTIHNRMERLMINNKYFYKINDLTRLDWYKLTMIQQASAYQSHPLGKITKTFLSFFNFSFYPPLFPVFL